MSGLRSERRETPNGSVLLVTLDRPEVLNAINSDMLEELDDLTREAAGDPATGGIVITGAGGRAFSAGADIANFTGLDAVAAEALMRQGQQVFQALEDAPLPVIAAINGYALGGGLELALACDVRLASNTAKMGQPEATLANLPGWGGTQRLPHILGEARAKDLIFTGRLIDAVEAERIGLVQAVFPSEELAGEALTYVSQMLRAGRNALRFAKEAIHASRSGGDAGYAVERQGVAICFTTEEQHEAVRRFLQKE